MNEYQEQALQFLKECNATMKIEFSHIGRNENWKEDNELREVYNFTITTPHGSYSSKFYDCIYNLKRKKEIEAQLKEAFVTGRDRVRLQQEYKELRPNEYDILACIEKYDPYTFEDFCSSYGYDEDSRTAERIYFACQKEYCGLRRIFTPEQMEMLQEIN